MGPFPKSWRLQFEILVVVSGAAGAPLLLAQFAAYGFNRIAHLGHRFSKLFLADIPGLTFLALLMRLRSRPPPFRNVIGHLVSSGPQDENARPRLEVSARLARNFRR
jgi:hypothetical protein